MARNKSQEERVKTLVAQLLAEEAEEGLSKEGEDINDIEDAMIRISDLVAREVGVQKLAAHTSRPVEDPPCPRCGLAGERQGERARKLVTRRGEVPLTEAKYRCPKCRRHFFPSDHGARHGDRLPLHAADVSADGVRRDTGGEFRGRHGSAGRTV